MPLLPPRRGVPALADNYDAANVSGFLPQLCIFYDLPERGLSARKPSVQVAERIEFELSIHKWVKLDPQLLTLTGRLATLGTAAKCLEPRQWD